MITEPIAAERCEMCGAEPQDGRAFCHFYPEGRQVTLCGAVCAEEFLRGPGPRCNGGTPRDFLEELAEERRWGLWRS